MANLKSTRMETKIKLPLYLIWLLLFAYQNFNAQYSCKFSSSINTSTTLHSNAQKSSQSLIDDSFSALYVPNAAMPQLNFRINFVFLMNPQQPTIFNGISKNQIVTDANNLISLMNAWYQSSGSIPPTMPRANQTALVLDPKIKLSLNAVYFDTTAIATASNNFGSSVYYKTFPHDTASVMNIYFYTELNSGSAGSGWAAEGKYCGIALPTPAMGGVYTSNTIFNNPRLVWHELGHSLGFFDDYYGGTYNNSDPSLANYRPDDATYDIAGGNNCSIPTNSNTLITANNNIMGSTPCREVMSAKQIAAFHYLVAINKTKKFTQFINQPYPYTPSQGPRVNITLTGNQTITSFPFTSFDTIIIKSRADITFQNLNLLARVNAKLIIEPNAILHLDRVTISSVNSNAFTWQGIDVWGDATAIQKPQFQGVLDIKNSTLSGAVNCISVGKRLINDNFEDNSGGGIVTVFNTTFLYNRIDVEFAPYIFHNRNGISNDIISLAPVKNNSSFYSCSFETSGSPQQNKFACILLRNVYGLIFSGCSFTSLINLAHKVDYGIYGLNSGFSVRKAGSISSKFIGFKNAICTNNYTSNFDINIDSSSFSNTVNNAIFLTNINFAHIKNCQFNLINYAPNSKTSAGIYLNNCTGYSIENNNFVGLGSASNTVMPSGIFVRQSGTNANSIYNNRFQGLSQGLWAIGQNYDSQNTNTGLLMNCNNFISCGYNIGVAKSSKLIDGLPNYTGIADVQGVASTPNPIDNVRNTYDVSTCIANDENKYNINTSNKFVLGSHGSFDGPQFHPTSQANNSCSNSSELVDVVGAPSGLNYCPVNPYYLVNASALNQQISDMHNSITNLQTEKLEFIDGGDTQALLNAIASNMSYAALKNLLLANSPYLSDEVLIAYFNRAGTPVGHISDIHTANKPVNKTVWNTILGLNLPSDIINQIKQQQNQNGLSPINFLVSKIKLYTTQLGLLYNEKLRRLIRDNRAGSVDSILTIYDYSNLNDGIIFKINTLTSLERYAEATSHLNNLLSIDERYIDYVFVQKEVIELCRNKSYFSVLKQDMIKKNRCLQLLTSGNYLAEGIATALLHQVWDVLQIDEEKDAPLRPAASTTQTPIGIAEVIKLNDALSIFPNPAKDVLIISYDLINSEKSATSNLDIVNSLGQFVLNVSLKEISTSIDISNLKPGLYFARVSNNSQVIAITKLVKE